MVFVNTFLLRLWYISPAADLFLLLSKEMLTIQQKRVIYTLVLMTLYFNWTGVCTAMGFEVSPPILNLPSNPQESPQIH